MIIELTNKTNIEKEIQKEIKNICEKTVDVFKTVYKQDDIKDVSFDVYDDKINVKYNLNNVLNEINIDFSSKNKYFSCDYLDNFNKPLLGILSEYLSEKELVQNIDFKGYKSNDLEFKIHNATLNTGYSMAKLQIECETFDTFENMENLHKHPSELVKLKLLKNYVIDNEKSNEKLTQNENYFQTKIKMKINCVEDNLYYNLFIGVKDSLINKKELIQNTSDYHIENSILPKIIEDVKNKKIDGLDYLPKDFHFDIIGGGEKQIELNHYTKTRFKEIDAIFVDIKKDDFDYEKTNLESIYSSVNSFYGKAKTRESENQIELFSYGNRLMTLIKDYDFPHLVDNRDGRFMFNSSTTTRHAKEFLYQQGLLISDNAEELLNMLKQNKVNYQKDMLYNEIKNNTFGDGEEFMRQTVNLYDKLEKIENEKTKELLKYYEFTTPRFTGKRELKEFLKEIESIKKEIGDVININPKIEFALGDDSKFGFIKSVIDDKNYELPRQIFKAKEDFDAKIENFENKLSKIDVDRNTKEKIQSREKEKVDTNIKTDEITNETTKKQAIKRKQ